MPRPTLYLMIGLPGVGKTTLARRIAEREGIARFTPDDWMQPLFGHNDAAGRRDILEGRMIAVAHEILRGGSSVVLDFGCWSPDERNALRAIAESAGANFEMTVCTLDEAERRRRCHERWLADPANEFLITEEQHDLYVSQVQFPTPDELEQDDVPSAPAGFATWGEWAADRWPSLPVIETR